MSAKKVTSHLSATPTAMDDHCGRLLYSSGPHMKHAEVNLPDQGSLTWISHSRHHTHTAHKDCCQFFVFAFPDLPISTFDFRLPACLPACLPGWLAMRMPVCLHISHLLSLPYYLSPLLSPFILLCLFLLLSSFLTPILIYKLTFLLHPTPSLPPSTSL